MIVVPAWFYRTLWTACAIIGAALLAPLPLTALLLVNDGTHNVEWSDWWTIVTSALLGAFVLWWSVRRLRHPLKSPRHVANTFE